MTKTITLFIATLFAISTNAQSVNCFSGRFDTEVFSSIDTSNDVTFGANTDYNGANTILTMDIYQPNGDTMLQRPLIVWVHGGSFISGTKNDNDVVALCQQFAMRGYVCASINYRLGISFPYNQANATNAVYRSVQDLKAAIRFFRKDAATSNTYMIDPTIVFAGGSSAGAFAALHLGYMDDYSELPTSIDTTVLGNLEGNSGNPGYSTTVNAVIDLCGALGSKTYMEPTDVPLCAMHGTADNVVPYATNIIYLLGAFPIMTVDGSYSVCSYADSIGLYNEFYTFYGSPHVPYYSNTTYMDTTVRFVSNFLYKQLGCTPADPNPLPNTFNTTTGLTQISNDASIYPNPSSGLVKIHLTKKVEIISVNNLLGKVILSKKINSMDTELDLSNLHGIYFIHADGKVIGKIVVE